MSVMCPAALEESRAHSTAVSAERADLQKRNGLLASKLQQLAQESSKQTEALHAALTKCEELGNELARVSALAADAEVRCVGESACD
jgi:hypothetical protein